jgi:protein O-mannosyl-transferase
MNQERNEVTFKSLFLPLTTKKAIIFIFLVGFAVFFNMLFNGFVLEDNAMILRNLDIRSIASIPNLFIHPATGVETITYYRPVLFTFYSIIYALSNLNPLPYHFAQLIFQILNAVLVFMLLKKFIKVWIAFPLSLLFLVHPVNQEATAWICCLQDILFIFFGLLGLHILEKDKFSLKSIFIACFLFLISILAKETGILFFIIGGIYILLFKKQKLLPYSLVSAGVGLIYAVLRLIPQTPLQKEPLVPIMNLNFWERMVNVPAIIFYYISILFYPKNLTVYHSWIIKKIEFGNFYAPAFFNLLFFTLLILGLLFVFKKNILGRISIFFLLWFVAGLVAHLQIFPIDFTVADHFFIFPFIGLLGFLGTVMQSIKINKYIKTGFIIFMIIVLCASSLRTIIRNINFASQYTLLSHDEKITNDYLLELVYSTELIKNNSNQALTHIKRALALYPGSWLAWNNLGVFYFQQGKINDARQVLTKSISIHENSGAYENMALLLLKHDKIDTAKSFIAHALKIYPNSWKLWYYSFVAANKIGDYDNSLISAKNYFLLKRDDQSYNLYLRLVRKLPIEVQ